MLDLLHRHYVADHDERASHVVIEEVAPATGFSGRARYADVVALGVWPSGGMKLYGYEIKATRADLKRELADANKWTAVGRYCDTWTLIAWDESVLVDGLPPEWGVRLVNEVNGVPELYTWRRSTPLEPEPWPRAFVASLVRNANAQSPRAAHVVRSVLQAQQQAMRDAKAEVERSHRESLRPLARALGMDPWTMDFAKVIGAAVERISATKADQ